MPPKKRGVEEKKDEETSKSTKISSAQTAPSSSSSLTAAAGAPQGQMKDISELEPDFKGANAWLRENFSEGARDTRKYANRVTYTEIDEKYHRYLPGTEQDTYFAIYNLFNDRVNILKPFDAIFTETTDTTAINPMTTYLVIDGEYSKTATGQRGPPKKRYGLLISREALEYKIGETVIEDAEKSNKELADRIGLTAALEEFDAAEIALAEAQERMAKAIENKEKKLIEYDIALNPAKVMSLESTQEAIVDEEGEPKEKGGPAALAEQSSSSSEPSVSSSSSSEPSVSSSSSSEPSVSSSSSSEPAGTAKTRRGKGRYYRRGTYRKKH